MAKLFNGSINFPSTMKPTGAQPLDDRSVVKSLTDLFAADTFGTAIYNGMMVSVVDEQQVYMLVDETKSTSEEGWIKVGSGNGSLAVETYAEAIALATDDNIGQVIYVKTKSSYDADGEEGEGQAVEYEAAPYIVIGNGQLQKLAASTASGSIEGDVAELKTKLSEVEADVKANADAIDALEAAKDDYKTADATLKDELQGEISTAEQNAKDYADGLDTAMDTRVKVLEAIDHEAYKAADATLKTDLQTEIAKKVDAIDGSRLMTIEEGNKLAGIAEGAQVNVLEKIKVNGNEVVIADADKSVDITIPSAPVQGVADGEKIIALNGDKLETTLTIAYVAASKDESGTHVPSQLRLQGKEGVVISSINADAFVKDGMIDSVTLEGPSESETGEKYLVITWNVDSGKEVTRLDVSDLFNPYNGGNGINLENGTFSIKLATGEQYLTVGTDGLATTEALWTKVTELDNTVLATAKSYAEEKATAAETAAKGHADGLNTAMNTRVEALEAIDHEHENKEVLDGITAEKVSAWDAAEQNAKDYADDTFVTKEGFNEFEAAYEEKLNGIAAGAEVNVIESVTVNGIEATIADKEASLTVAAKDIELGEVIKNGEEVKYEANAKISTVLQSIQESIRGAIAGGVNSVSSGDKAITVNSADANNPVITLNTETSTEETVQAGHIELLKGDNGIYGVMYYDGDDTEE